MLKILAALEYLCKYLINTLTKYLYEKVMLHENAVFKFWEDSYLGLVLDSCWLVLDSCCFLSDSCWFVLTRVGLVLTRVDSCWLVSDSCWLVLDACWFVLTRVDLCWFVLTRVDLCWYLCIRIDLIESLSKWNLNYWTVFPLKHLCQASFLVKL